MPPTVTFVSPPVSTTIASNTPFVVTVTDPVGFSQIVVAISFVGFGIVELVHDGTQFTAAYVGLSSRTGITNGFQYTIRRSPVWPDSPAATVFAVNATGGATIGVGAWTLAGAPPPSGIAPTEPVFPIAPGPNACPAPQHDEAYFLQVLGNFLEQDFVEGLQAGGGYELLQAFAASGQRVSSAIEHYECGMFILSAQGGAFAVGSVEFFRTDPSAGAYVLKAGTLVTTSTAGRDFVTTQDVAVGTGTLGPYLAPVQAVWQAWEWNVSGQKVTRRGETIPGSIDTIKQLITVTSTTNATPVIDPSLQVQQILDITGGRAPMLDGLGEDRGVFRKPGEGDPAYQLRIRTLPDTVSPGAIQRFINATMLPYNVSAEFIEFFSVTFQTCWDAPVALPLNPDFDPTLFVWDDPRPNIIPSWRDRWLDDVIAEGAFGVIVPILQPIHDYGFAWDDPATSTAGLTSSAFLNGARAIPAWDVPSGTALGIESAWGGFDTGYLSLIHSIEDQLQQIKAGGVTAVVLTSED